MGLYEASALLTLPQERKGICVENDCSHLIKCCVRCKKVFVNHCSPHGAEIMFVFLAYC